MLTRLTFNVNLDKAFGGTIVTFSHIQIIKLRERNSFCAFFASWSKNMCSKYQIPFCHKSVQFTLPNWVTDFYYCCKSVYECQANVIFEVLSSSLILRKSANKSSNLELYHKIVWLFMPSQVLLSILIKWLVGAICKIGRAPKINSDT